MAQRWSARELIDLVLDDRSFESWDQPVDLTGHSEAYQVELRAAAEKAGTDESVLTGRGLVRGRPVAVVVNEFAFLGGSIGRAAADRIVSSTGNTTVHMVAAIGRPWIVVPEWRYFDEQVWKARMLDRAGAAVMLDHWPSHADAWLAAWQRAAALDLERQQGLVNRSAANLAASWLQGLIEHRA